MLGPSWALGQQHLPLAQLAAEGMTGAVHCCLQTLLIPALWGKPWAFSHNIEDNYVAVNKWWWLHSLILKHDPGHFDLLFFFKFCHQKCADHLAQAQLTMPEMWLMLVTQ